ncbi:uncharacterized protein LOC117122646 isoform X2 [Anneissia japonica]|uniref:uncharacterized protein LOC117122646 isoform X2 n=1 Tax=Anneissia japonica TaxID=1529436 RepID=UPI0014259B2C|nr:uncharacterized protein LOC117122646 isoform X2 [Anneissia japonica]
MVVTRKEVAARRALRDAIEIGDVRSVRKCLDNGGDVNATEKDDVDGSQHSFLILAICQHQFGVAKELVERGADVGTVYLNYDAKHACIYSISAHKAAQMIYDESSNNIVSEILTFIEEYLKKCETKEIRRVKPTNLPPVHELPSQVLIDAVSEGDVECINLLLDYGMDINIVHRNSTSNMQQSVLIFAIYVNQIDTARNLIEKGADVDTIFQNYDSDEQMYETTALQTARDRLAKSPNPDIEKLVELLSNQLMKRMGKQPRIIAPFEKTEILTDTSMTGNNNDIKDDYIEQVPLDDLGKREPLKKMTSGKYGDDTTTSTACILL